MPHAFNDDPTIPPPGKRTGAGIGSILPFLAKSLATNPHVPDPEDESTVAQLDPPALPPARGAKPKQGRES